MPPTFDGHYVMLEIGTWHFHPVLGLTEAQSLTGRVTSL